MGKLIVKCNIMEDKMKKKISLWVGSGVLILLLIVGVTVVKEKIIKMQQAYFSPVSSHSTEFKYIENKEITEDVLEDSEKIQNISQDITPIIDGYNIFISEWIDDNTLFLGYYKESEDSISVKLCSFIVDSKKIKTIYEKDYGLKDKFIDLTEWGVKVLNNRNIAFTTNQDIIIFTKDTLKISKTITLPENVDDFDISYKGTELVYETKDGIYKSNLEFKFSGILVANEVVNSSDLGECQIHPFNPKWSYDDSKILYFKTGKEDLDGLGIISADGYKNVLFKEVNNSLNGYWFTDNNKIATEQDLFYTNSYIVDIDEEWVRAIHRGHMVNKVKPAPYYNRIAYHDGINKEVYILDLDTRKRKVVGKYDTISSLSWSADARNLTFISNEETENKLFIVSMIDSI